MLLPITDEWLRHQAELHRRAAEILVTYPRERANQPVTSEQRDSKYHDTQLRMAMVFEELLAFRKNAAALEALVRASVTRKS